jgi:hypothetical protein
MVVERRVQEPTLRDSVEEKLSDIEDIRTVVYQALQMVV